MSCFTFGKSVHFDKTVKVFYYRQRQHESDVNWMQVACDRFRFKRHMLNIEQKIGRVLGERHRNNVYNKLYIETEH